MKKVLVILAAAGMLFAMSSCSKTCTCTATVAGVSTSTEVNLDDYKDQDIKKCSDLGSAHISGLANYECK